MTEAPSERGSLPYVCAISIVAAMGGFLFGYDLAIFSGAVIFLEKAFRLSSAGLGFAAGSAILGCIAGAIAAVGVADRLGRNNAFFIAAATFAVSAVMTAVAGTFAVFCAFRCVGGVGVGLASVVSPMYIAEVSPARIRGRLVTLNQFAIVIGAIASIVVAYILASYVSDRTSWRWMFASECVPIVGFAIALPLIPQSPRWLLQKDRVEEASRVLTRIAGPDRARAELAAIGEALRAERGSLRDLLAPGVRTALLVAVALAFFQQWTGNSPIGIYAAKIFQQAGFEESADAIKQALIMHIFKLPCVIAAIWLVDRFGRRPLLLAGTAGMGIGAILLGALFASQARGLPVLAAMLLSVLAFETTMAPIAWLVMSEIFPTRLRAVGMGVASFVLWVSAYTVWQAFPSMAEFSEHRLGTWAGAFWFFAAVCAAAFAFAWKMVPETKGKTLEEIARHWVVGAAPPRRS